MPNFVVRILLDLKYEIVCREYGFLNSKTSFMSSGNQPFLTLKISVINFFRFLWWIFKELSSVSNSWNDELKSVNLRALSWIWLILSFSFLLWNTHTIGQYEKCVWKSSKSIFFDEMSYKMLFVREHLVSG